MNSRTRSLKTTLRADFGANTPLYRGVRQQILRRLTEGKWKPGERLPPEGELAELFSVAISTVRAGVDELIAAGVLLRRQGKGTYVASHNPYGPQLRYSNVFDAQGDKVVTSREILSTRIRRADRDMARLLRLDPNKDARVHQVDSRLHVDGKAVAVTTLVLPVALFQGLRREDFRDSMENLYFGYQQRYNITVVRMEERVSARTATAKTASLLGLKIGHPILRVERVAYSFNDLPVEIRYRLYEGLNHHYLFTHDKLG